MTPEDQAATDHRACEYSRRFGIYAKPCTWDDAGKILGWMPQVSDSDVPVPPMAFWKLASSQPFGWPDWASAVIALGEWLEEQA